MPLDGVAYPVVPAQFDSNHVVNVVSVIGTGQTVVLLLALVGDDYELDWDDLRIHVVDGSGIEARFVSGGQQRRRWFRKPQRVGAIFEFDNDPQDFIRIHDEKSTVWTSELDSNVDPEAG